MGRDKATLFLGGRRLFDFSRRIMEQFFSRVVIAGDRPDLAGKDLRYFPDIYPGSALGGLYTALYHAETPYIFATACDLPFPNPAMVRTLLEKRHGSDVVLFKTEQGLEPLFALYGKTCLEPMHAMLVEGSFRIYDFFDQVRTRYVQANPALLKGGPMRPLFNINTPEDFSLVSGLAGKKP
jgi:molybdopterin-guanine dinucleotide biosynthesis protein A